MVEEGRCKVSVLSLWQTDCMVLFYTVTGQS